MCTYIASHDVLSCVRCSCIRNGGQLSLIPASFSEHIIYIRFCTFGWKPMEAAADQQFAREDRGALEPDCNRICCIYVLHLMFVAGRMDRVYIYFEMGMPPIIASRRSDFALRANAILAQQQQQQPTPAPARAPDDVAGTTRRAPGNMCTGACELILHFWFAQELMTFPHFQCRDKHRCRSSFKHCLCHFQHSPRYDSIMPSPLAIGAGCLGRWS